MNKFAIFISTAILLAACNGSSSSGDGVAADAKGDISQSRSAAFKSMMPTFSTMRKMANGDQAFVAEEFKSLANQFSKEAREPFDYFQNDPQGNGDALPVIWQKPAEFKAQQDKFLAAVDKLNAAAQAGKLDEIKVSVEAVGESCKSCHSTFRRPK